MNGLNASVIIQTQPSTEPISVEDFKSFSKFSDDFDDDHITDYLIPSVRMAAERYTNLHLINTTIKQTQNYIEFNGVNNFVAFNQLSHYAEINNIHRLGYIQLLKFPVASIVSLIIYNNNNTPTTINNSNYFLDNGSGRLIFNDDYILITNTRASAGIEISYIAGYGTAANVPMDIKLAMLIHLQNIYDSNRTNVNNNLNMPYQMPDAAIKLLQPYRQIIGLNG